MSSSSTEPRPPSARVIHTAQALVDEVVDIAALPPRGGNAVATSWTRYAGGAVNVLAAASRSGALAVHAGSVGTGPNADLVLSALAADGIVLSSPLVTDADTGICFVMVEASAERTFVTTQGAERRISRKSLASSAPVAGDLLCLSGFSLVGPTCAPLLAFVEALDPGVVVVLDPGAAFADLDPALRERVLARTGVWTSNAAEAHALTGEALPVDSVAAVADLLPPEALAVVRDGPEGCHVRAAGVTTAVPGHPQRAVDTNGAGDTHTGVLAAELARGRDLVVAAERANVAGAIKVTRRGPATAPTSAEIDAFLAALPGDADRRAAAGA